MQVTSSTQHLPELDDASKEHCQKVFEMLQIEITQNGPMPFRDYMEKVLYEPGLGYYSAGSLKLGRSGDFVTAPEISPLFSKCLAKQCAEVLKKLPEGNLLEFGAGSGEMAKDILLELEKLKSLPQRYQIIELSADLRERQKEKCQKEIPHLFSRIEWLDQLPNEKWEGVVLANEVLDAMPVHKFTMQDGIKEYYVDIDHEEFVWRIDEPSDKFLVEAVKNLDVNFSEEYTSEINGSIEPWISSIAHFLERGCVLLIDYGFPRNEYYHPDRHQGTLMCHFRHHAHDNPLIHPGIQDITAHVDFTCVAESAVNNGLNVMGYSTQANFLLSCGIDQIMQESDQVEWISLAQQAKTLMLPGEMGELFKVMALGRNIEEPLLGFQMQDSREKL